MFLNNDSVSWEKAWHSYFDVIRLSRGSFSCNYLLKGVEVQLLHQGSQTSRKAEHGGVFAAAITVLTLVRIHMRIKPLLIQSLTAKASLINGVKKLARSHLLVVKFSLFSKCVL